MRNTILFPAVVALATVVWCGETPRFPGDVAEAGLSVSESSPTAVPGGHPGHFEISPTFGFMGGSAMLGVRASMNYHPVTLEFSSDQVMGNAATLYPMTMNVVLDLAKLAQAVPYGTVGGGLFLTVPGNSVGDETISSVGLSFGGGLRYYVNANLGIRFETKQLFTRVENRFDHREELLIFQSTSLGVIFAFG